MMYRCARGGARDGMLLLMCWLMISLAVAVTALAAAVDEAPLPGGDHVVQPPYATQPALLPQGRARGRLFNVSMPMAASKLFKVTLPKLVVSFAKRDGTTAVLKVSPLSPFLPLVKALSNFF